MILRPLHELIDLADPAMPLIRDWVRCAENTCEILPPSAERAGGLLRTQVTTRSPMGAIVYETGGILIDGGWIRFLGSGHQRLSRVLPDWNAGRASGFYLVAEDAVGGFFAINGGAFGPELKTIYYWAPDSLNWMSMSFGFTDFFRWCLTSRVADFYRDLRWPAWREDTARLSGDESYSFYPFLWTKEGTLQTSRRAAIPIHEAFDLKVELVRQLGNASDGTQFILRRE